MVMKALAAQSAKSGSFSSTSREKRLVGIAPSNSFADLSPAKDIRRRGQ